jgi:cellulose synthase (UDP-forming)
MQALFLGTNAIFSRQAVEAVGRFPTDCLTEDTLITLRLHAAGYRTLYYPRSHTSGLAPDTIKSAYRQRSRWAQGHLQVRLPARQHELRGGAWP